MIVQCPRCHTYYETMGGHACTLQPDGSWSIQSRPPLAVKLAGELRGAITAEFAHTRERSLALTKLDELELWLGKAQPEAAAPLAGTSDPQGGAA